MRRARISNAQPQSAGHGHHRMLATADGIIGDALREKVIAEYHRLNSKEARCAFARSWLRQIAINVEATVPVFYELVALVREYELYKGTTVGDTDSFETFDAYLAARFGALIKGWRKFEETEPVFTSSATAIPGSSAV